MDRSSRHGPNRLRNYLDIHETVIARYVDSGAIEEDLLAFGPGANGRFEFDAELVLRGRKLKLTVTKALEVLQAEPPAYLVQTLFHSYNLSIVGCGTCCGTARPMKAMGPTTTSSTIVINTTRLIPPRTITT